MNLKSAQSQYQRTYPPADEKPTTPEFPSARYFQVHFEYLESQLLENKRSMEQLQKQMADLCSTLSKLKPEVLNNK
jgi:hypothetical protein